VLVHVYLNTRIAAIEIHQRFSTVLHQRRSGQRANYEMNAHSHHGGVAFSVTPVEEAKHLLFELLAVFVDTLSRLFDHYEELPLQMPALSSHLLSDRDVNLFRHSRQPT
jgi:hypothetical protein